MKNFNKNDLMKEIISLAIGKQKKYVRSHYPEVTDFDIKYDHTDRKFQYTGLTHDQIKTLPGISEID